MDNKANAFDLRDTGSGSIHRSSSAESLPTSPTLRIHTAGGGGSGVVIGKNNNVYTLLTANHVVKGYSLAEIEIQVGESFVKPIDVTNTLDAIDLAVVTFQSQKLIPRAFIPSLDKNFWNEIKGWHDVRVEGYSNASRAVQGVTRRVSSGEILSIISGNKDGYDLLHDATTNVGMSGGGLYGKPYGTAYSTMYASVSNVLSDDSEFEFIDDITEIILMYKHTPEGVVYEDGFIEALGSWDNSRHNEVENSFFKQCLAKRIKPNSGNYLTDIFYEKIFKNSSPRNEFYKTDCQAAAYQVQGQLGSCTIPSYDAIKLAPRRPFDQFLLAIHGRSEDYSYGGKSGAGLAIFLGSDRVTKWLNENSKKFGLIERSGLYMTCRHKILLPDNSY